MHHSRRNEPHSATEFRGADPADLGLAEALCPAHMAGCNEFAFRHPQHHQPAQRKHHRERAGDNPQCQVHCDLLKYQRPQAIPTERAVTAKAASAAISGWSAASDGSSRVSVPISVGRSAVAIRSDYSARAARAVSGSDQCVTSLAHDAKPDTADDADAYRRKTLTQ